MFFDVKLDANFILFISNCVVSVSLHNYIYIYCFVNGIFSVNKYNNNYITLKPMFVSNEIDRV